MLKRKNFASGFCTEGVSWVREACSWQDCVFSASKDSQVNGCGRLLGISNSIYARKNME